MAKKRNSISYDQKAMRHWTLYVVRFTDETYYVGITSYKDFMRRIRQHGGRTGARINQNKVIAEIIEIHPLGILSGAAAGRIENDMMLEYRRRFGANKVRGGYEISRKTSVIPNFTPGSRQSIIFIGTCLSLALLIVFFLAQTE